MVHKEQHNPSPLETYNSNMGELWEQMGNGKTCHVWRQWRGPGFQGQACWVGRWQQRSRFGPRRFVHLPAQESSRSAVGPATGSQTCSWVPRSPVWLSRRLTCREEWPSPKLCIQAHTWSTGRTSAPASTVPLPGDKTGAPRALRPPGCNGPLNWAWWFGCRLYPCTEVLKWADKIHAPGRLFRCPLDTELISAEAEGVQESRSCKKSSSQV